MSVPRNAAFSSKVWKAPCCRGVQVEFQWVRSKVKQVTYAELRRGVDELELYFLEIPARSVDHERLADGDDTLLGSGDRALEDEEVVLDNTVMGEATHWCDGLLGDVRLG